MISSLSFVIRNGHLYDFLKSLNPLRFGRKAINLTLANTLLWFFRSKPFHIIHTHFGLNGEKIADLKSQGFLKNTKLVNTFHGYDFRPALIEEWKIRYKHLFEQADLLTYNTPYSRGILEKIAPNLSKFIELPVGLDTSYFVKSPIKNHSSSNIFNVLFCGRLVEVKAPDLAIDAMQIIVNEMGIKNVRLTLVGEGPLEKMVKELVKKYNLEDYIELKGSLNQGAVKEEMGKADLFFLPGIEEPDGRAETQGLVIQEAQAMELPVLVSDTGGMKYGLIDGETGFVLPQKNTKGFAEKIVYLMKNPDLRNKMGKKGREFVVENYDSKVLGAKLENLYFSLLKK